MADIVKFKKRDIVIPLAGDYKGEIGSILEIFPDTHHLFNTIIVEFWREHLSEHRESEHVESITGVFFNPLKLENYKNPDALIRPLVIGDKAVISKKLTIFFTELHLPYKGRVVTISDISESRFATGTNGLRYHANDLPWILENINIPETNRLLLIKPKIKKDIPVIPII